MKCRGSSFIMGIQQINESKQAGTKWGKDSELLSREDDPQEIEQMIK